MYTKRVSGKSQKSSIGNKRVKSKNNDSGWIRGAVPFENNPEVLTENKWGSIRTQIRKWLKREKKHSTESEKEKIKKGSKEENKTKSDESNLNLGKIPTSTSGSGKYIKAILFFAIMAPLLFANAYIENVKTGTMELIGLFYPQVADYWDTIVIIVSIIFIISGTILVLYYNSVPVMVVLIVLVVVWMLLFPFLYSYVDPESASTYGASLMCILSNLANPEGIQQCTMIASPTEPESVKVGSYEVLKVSFDTEYIGNTIYKDSNNQIKFNTFFMNMIVENPSETRTVENFCIIKDGETGKSTAITRGGTVKTSEKIKLADLSTQDGRAMCDNENSQGVTIGPGEKLRLTIVAKEIDWCSNKGDKEACEKIDVCDWDDEKCVTEDRKTREVEAKVTYKYDYSGEGHFDFVVGKSDSKVESLVKTRARPTKSDGPVDVTVYFSPTAYVIRDLEENSMNAIVKVSKTEGEYAIMYTPIRISRLVDGILTPHDTCEALWGDADVVHSGSTELVETLSPLGSKSKLTNEHTYICNYAINKDDVGEYGEVIPFIARADYTLVDTLTKKGIKVYEE